MYAPCGRARFGGLAEEEAELLQALGEDVFARHGEWQSGRRREGKEAVYEAEGYHEAGRGRRCIIQLFPMAVIRPAKRQRR